MRDYRNGLRRVEARLGQVPLQSLRPLDLEELYASLLRDGRRSGGGLAPKTVRNIHIALRRSLADAHRFGLVTRNVATLVKPPVPVRAELSTWTAGEVRRFLDAVADDRLMPAYRLLASTGMRRGEALRLHWSDVDLSKARLAVNRSLTAVDEPWFGLRRRRLGRAGPCRSIRRRSRSCERTERVRPRRSSPPHPRGSTRTWSSAMTSADRFTRTASRVRSQQPSVGRAHDPFGCMTSATPGQPWLSKPACTPRS